MLFNDNAEFRGVFMLSFIAVGVVEGAFCIVVSSSISGFLVVTMFVTLFWESSLFVTTLLKKSGLTILAEPFFFLRELKPKPIALNIIRLTSAGFCFLGIVNRKYLPNR